MARNERILDGGNITLYNTDNAASGTIMLDSSAALKLTGGTGGVLIASGSNLTFGGNATIGGTNSTITIGKTGDTIAFGASVSGTISAGSLAATTEVATPIIDSIMPLKIQSDINPQGIYVSKLLVSNNYANDADSIPGNGIYSKGDIITGGQLRVTGATTLMAGVFINSETLNLNNDHSNGDVYIYLKSRNSDNSADWDPYIRTDKTNANLTISDDVKMNGGLVVTDGISCDGFESTGDIILPSATANGDTPAIAFLRGASNDIYTDYRLINQSGTFKLQGRGPGGDWFNALQMTSTFMVIDGLIVEGGLSSYYDVTFQNNAGCIGEDSLSEVRNIIKIFPDDITRVGDLNTGLTLQTNGGVLINDTYEIYHEGNKPTASDVGAQPLDADLTAIAGLSDSGVGFLKKTAANTWILETSVGGVSIAEEEIIATSNQTIFNLTTCSYTPGTGTLEVFINGIRQCRDAFIENSSTQFTMKAEMEAGDFVLARVFMVQTTIVPDLSIYEQTFDVTAGQTVFNLTNGSYKINTNRLNVFINGIRQPKTAFTETSATSFTMNLALEDEDVVMAQYFDTSNVRDDIHSSRHITGGADPMPIATQSTDGLLSSEDKAFIDDLIGDDGFLSSMHINPSMFLIKPSTTWGVYELWEV